MEEEPEQEQAVLEIPIYFNPLATTPEQIADVIDGIIENALSTMGIMDECGDPDATVGAVSVSSPTITQYDLDRAIDLRRQAERQCDRIRKEFETYKGVIDALRAVVNRKKSADEEGEE